MTSEEKQHYNESEWAEWLNDGSNLGWLNGKRDLLEQAWKKTTEEVSKTSRPTIQDVPEYMASRAEFKKFYEPQVITTGLTRRRRTHLGGPSKNKWTAMYLNHTKQNIEDLFQRVFTHKRELLENFGGQPRLNINDDNPRLWALVVDGCSILQVLDKSDNSVDPEQELYISIDKLVQVHQDLLILDNQIPFQLLRLLCKDESMLEKCLQNFLEIHGLQPDNKGKEKGNKSTHNEPAEMIVQVEDNEPIHLLDYLRRALLKRDIVQIPIELRIKRKNLHPGKYRIGTIRELKAAGIRVKKDPSNNTFYPSFNDGTLNLPELTVDGSTALMFVNLMAYEMCPDFRNDLEITSYVVFMSSLIDQPEDVKELRSARILINQLANDKEVADLFNKMDSVLVPETLRFANIRDQIHNHFESRRHRIKILGWMGEAFETYFRSPWTVIALLAGSLGLILTFIQTWFAIHPKGW